MNEGHDSPEPPPGSPHRSPPDPASEPPQGSAEWPHDPTSAAPPNPEATPAPAPTHPPEPAFAWTPDLAAGRVLDPSAPAKGPRPRPWLDRLAWTLGLLVAIGLSTVIVRLGYASDVADDARRVGQVLGTVASALIFAFAFWAVVVWISRRRGSPRRLTSPIVVLVAIVLLLIRLGGVTPTRQGVTALAPTPSPAAAAVSPGASSRPATSLGPSAGAAGSSVRPSLDPAIHAALLKTLVIDPPYALADPPPDEERELLSVFSGEEFALVRDIAVRRVLDDQGIVGLVIVADIGADPALEAVTLAGFEMGLRGDGGTSTRETISGRTVLIGQAGGTAFAAWVEAPYLRILYGYDAATVRTIGEAFLTPKQG